MKLQFGWMLSPRDVKYSSLHLVIGSIELRLKGINDQTPNYIYKFFTISWGIPASQHQIFWNRGLRVILKMHGSLNLHLAGLINEPVQHFLSYI